MPDKKELNLEELEKVSGGAKIGWDEGDPVIDKSSYVSEDKAKKQYIGKDLFFCSRQTWIYGTLIGTHIESFHDLGEMGVCTVYDVFVTKTNNQNLYSLNKKHSVDSSDYYAYERGTFPHPMG